MGRARQLVWMAVLIGALLNCAAAAASSGEVTRAESSLDEQTAAIAGVITWNGCAHMPEAPGKDVPGSVLTPPPPPGFELEPAYCGWAPFATLGPGADPSQCADPGRRDPEALGQGIELIWSEPERRSQGVAGFELDGVPLDSGSRLVCLSAIEVGPRHIVCVQVEGHYCPPYRMGSAFVSFGGANLIAPGRPTAAPGVSPPGADDTTVPVKKAKTRKKRKRVPKRKDRASAPRVHRHVAVP